MLAKIKALYGSTKEFLAFLSLALSIFLTFRDKLQMSMSGVLALARIPYLGFALALTFAGLSVVGSLFLMKRSRPSTLAEGYTVPYYGSNVRRFAALYLRFILPGALVLGLLVAGKEALQFVYDRNPVEVTYYLDGNAVTVVVRNSGRFSKLFFEEFELGLLGISSPPTNISQVPPPEEPLSQHMPQIAPESILQPDSTLTLRVRGTGRFGYFSLRPQEAIAVKLSLSEDPKKRMLIRVRVNNLQYVGPIKGQIAIKGVEIRTKTAILGVVG